MAVTGCGSYLILCGVGRSDVEPSGSTARVLFIMLMRSITNIMICLRNWNHLNFYQGNERFSAEIITIYLKVLMTFRFLNFLADCSVSF